MTKNHQNRFSALAKNRNLIVGLAIGLLALVMAYGFWILFLQTKRRPPHAPTAVVEQVASRNDEPASAPAGQVSPAPPAPSVEATNAAIQPQISQPTSTELTAEWKRAIDSAFSQKDLNSAIILLAGPPETVSANELSSYHESFWPWLLDARSASAAPPVALQMLLPPENKPSRDFSLYQSFPDPQRPGGWFGISARAIYRTTPEGIWQEAHRFSEQLSSEDGSVYGIHHRYLRVEPLVHPGLVVATAPTKSGPGGWSRDGGVTWTWLTWPKQFTSISEIELAPLGDGRLVLGVRQRGEETSHLYLQKQGGWDSLGIINGSWTTIPLPVGGFIVEAFRPDRLRTKTLVRFWTQQANDWTKPTWDASIVRWTGADAYFKRSAAALLPDRCAVISPKGVCWVGAHGVLIKTVANMDLAKRGLDGWLLAVDPQNPEHLWCTFRNLGVWRSYDAGEHWQRGRDAIATVQARMLWVDRVNNEPVLFSNAWSLRDEPSNWEEQSNRPKFTRAPLVNESLAPAVERALKRNQQRRLQLDFLTTPSSAITETLGQMGHVLEQGKKNKIAEQFLDKLRDQGTIGRNESVAFLLAWAGPHFEKEINNSSISTTNWTPPQLRLAEILPITMADLATSPQSAVLYAEARVRAMWSANQHEPIKYIRLVQESDRLVQWLESYAPGDPHVFALRVRLEVALWHVLVKSSSVVRKQELEQAFPGQSSRIKMLFSQSLARCLQKPSDQTELQALRLVALLIADQCGKAPIPGGRLSLTKAAVLLEGLQPITDIYSEKVLASDRYFLRFAVANDAIAYGSPADALALIKTISPPAQRAYTWSESQCGRLLLDLCVAVGHRTKKMHTPAECALRVDLRRQVLRLCSFTGFGTVESFIDRVLSPKTLENQLAWDLLTLPERSIHDPKEALALATKAVERDERKSADFLDTLALAQVRTNKRHEAVRTQEEALAKISAREPKARRDYFQQRLNLYRELAKNPTQPLPDECFRDVSHGTTQPPAPESAPKPDDPKDF